MATVIQLPTLTAWANGGTMPTGLDAFGAYLDTDGLTCWLFQDFKSGFARVNLGTNTIIFQGNLFNVAGGTGLDSRYDGTPLFLQDDAGHYYWQQSGTIYKMHVAPSAVGTIGNGYLTVDATLAAQPTNITRWYLFKTPINNTRYIITMTGDTPNGVAHVINADTMTAVGTFSPPQVPNAGQPGISQTGVSVGAYMDANTGNFSLWFSDNSLANDNLNVCNVQWNPNMGVNAGILNVIQPEPNYHLNFLLVDGQCGINWITYLPSRNYILVSNNEVFTSGAANIDQTPLPAQVLGAFFDNDARAFYCGTFDASTSAYDVGPQKNDSVIGLPGDIIGSTVQVGGILNIINPSSSSLPLINSYNVTQLINLSPNVTFPVPADVTVGRGDKAITSVSGDGVHATYICNNNFTVGQKVTTVQCTPAAFNIDNLVITAATATQFSVALAVTQASTPQGANAAASVTFAPFACMRYSATRNAVLVTYEYAGSPAYWVILTGPPPVIQGNFQDLEGNPLANGYVTFKLTADASIAGVGQIGAGAVTTVPLDATGNATGQQGIWPNDQMVPTDTKYVMTAYSAAGQPVWQKTAAISSSPTPFPLQNLQ